MTAATHKVLKVLISFYLEDAWVSTSPGISFHSVSRVRAGAGRRAFIISSSSLSSVCWSSCCGLITKDVSKFVCVVGF